MSPRTGRPKAENPKCIDVKARFDQQLYDAATAYCKAHEITLSEAIRRGIELLMDQKK